MLAVRFWSLLTAMLVAASGLADAARAADAKGKSLAQYVSPDFCAALVIHPERIKKSPLAAALPAQKEQSPAEALATLEKLGGKAQLPPGMDVEKLAKLIGPNSLQRLVILIDPTPSGDMPASAGWIMQFSADIPGEEVLAAICNQWTPGKAGAATYQTVKLSEPKAPPIAVHVADARTILAGPEPTVVKMLTNKASTSPLLEQLRQTSLNHDMILEVAVAPLAARLEKSGAAGSDAGGGAMMAGMAQDIKALSLTLNFSGDSLLHAVLATTKEETATQLAMMANMGVQAGKGQLDELKKSLQALEAAYADAGVDKELVATLFAKLGDEIFAGLTINSEGDKLIANLATPASLPEAIKTLSQLGPMLMPALMSGGGPPAGGDPGAAKPAAKTQPAKPTAPKAKPAAK